MPSVSYKTLHVQTASNILRSKRIFHDVYLSVYSKLFIIFKVRKKNSRLYAEKSKFIYCLRCIFFLLLHMLHYKWYRFLQSLKDGVWNGGNQLWEINWFITRIPDIRICFVWGTIIFLCCENIALVSFAPFKTFYCTCTFFILSSTHHIDTFSLFKQSCTKKRHPNWDCAIRARLIQGPLGGLLRKLQTISKIVDYCQPSLKCLGFLVLRGNLLCPLNPVLTISRIWHFWRPQRPCGVG